MGTGWGAGDRDKSPWRLGEGATAFSFESGNGKGRGSAHANGAHWSLAFFCPQTHAGDCIWRAKGACQFQPWATPKGHPESKTKALKARFIISMPRRYVWDWMQADETRFQRSGLPVQPNLGRCPRLELKDAVGVPAGSIAPWALRLAHQEERGKGEGTRLCARQRRALESGLFLSANSCRRLHLARQRRMSIPALGNAQGSPGASEGRGVQVQEQVQVAGGGRYFISAVRTRLRQREIHSQKLPGRSNTAATEAKYKTTVMFVTELYHQ